MYKYSDFHLIFSLFQSIPSKGKLYLGAVGLLNHPQLLLSNHITCVLSALDDQTYSYCRVADKLQNASISINKHINIENSEQVDLLPHFKDSYEFIRSNLEHRNMFVHCQAGVSRSATLVIAFLMKENNWTRQEARNYVREKRRVIAPNNRFLSELKKWQELLSNKIDKI